MHKFLDTGSLEVEVLLETHSSSLLEFLKLRKGMSSQYKCLLSNVLCSYFFLNTLDSAVRRFLRFPKTCTVLSNILKSVIYVKLSNSNEDFKKLSEMLTISLIIIIFKKGLLASGLL